jgi:hypothetical protein
MFTQVEAFFLFRFLGYYEYVGHFYTSGKNRKTVDAACGKAFGE